MKSLGAYACLEVRAEGVKPRPDMKPVQEETKSHCSFHGGKLMN